MKRKVLFGLTIVMCSLCLFTGCGKKADPELDEYKKSMTEFYDSLTYYDKAINAIDPESEDAGEVLLGYLDEIPVCHRTEFCFVNKAYDEKIITDPFV